MNIKNIISLGLVPLCLLACSESDSQPSSKTTNKTVEVESGKFTSAKIAFFVSDTLITQYEYRKDLTTKFEAKAKKAEADLAIYSRAFEDNYKVLVENQDKLTPQQLQNGQMELQQKEQELIQMRDEMTAALRKEEAELTQLVMQDVREVVEELRVELGVDFILSKGQGSNIGAANPDFDITDMLVARLNKRYEEKKNEDKK